LSSCPRSSLPVEVLAWLACRLAHLLPPRPPGRGGTRPLSLEIRLDAVGAVLLDGLSYRRAGRMVGISKTEVGDSIALLLGETAKLGICQPDGTFVTNLADLAQRLVEMAATGVAAVVDGLATRVQRPRSWANQKVLYDAKRHTHTAQGVAVSTIHGDLLWCDGGWPGSCHEHELLTLFGDRPGPGRYPGHHPGRPRVSRLAKARAHWHAPTGDRRTRAQRTTAERASNRCQAGLRALVEQSIGHLATAWSLRRWRGLLYRVRDVFRAAAALISLGRLLHRLPAHTGITDTLNVLRNALREFYPGVLAALGAQLAEPEALAVLELAPTPEQGWRLTRAAVPRALVDAGRRRTCRQGWWRFTMGWRQASWPRPSCWRPHTVRWWAP
jgi:hypothetical protein